MCIKKYVTMNLYRSSNFIIGLLRPEVLQITVTKGIKYFPPPKNYDDIEIPERQRLRLYEKVPQYPPNLRPPKMQKRLRYMRGPELLHNTLQLKQYGIVATGGGRLRHEHFEMARLQVARRLDMKRMFAIWRVDPPWQPVTKKGQGQRMGGGKGAIDHYVTPIKNGRIILEIGGKCEYAEIHNGTLHRTIANFGNNGFCSVYIYEDDLRAVAGPGWVQVAADRPFKLVKDMLRIIAERLPFKAEPVSQEIMEKKAEKVKWEEENNQNKYTLKYLIQNNMGGCHKHISPFDHKWYGKYL